MSHPDPVDECQPGYSIDAHQPIVDLDHVSAVAQVIDHLPESVLDLCANVVLSVYKESVTISFQLIFSWFRIKISFLFLVCKKRDRKKWENYTYPMVESWLHPHQANLCILHLHIFRSKRMWAESTLTYQRHPAKQKQVHKLPCTDVLRKEIR